MAESSVDWVNGHTRFEERSVDAIKELWETRWASTGGLHVYVHGPFCAQLCSFCMHQGLRASKHRADIQTYYQDYLPAHLMEFVELFSRASIEAIYFGGGTADIMPSGTMPRIFSAIPGFSEIPSKVFEAHPATLSERQIEQLILHRFAGGYVSFGVQTFDRKICEREHRIYVSPEKLRSKVRMLQQSGIRVNVDLVAFLDTPDVASLELLTHDLALLTSEVKPDTITIYPLRQAFTHRHQVTQVSKAKGKALERLLNHRRVLTSALFDAVGAFVASQTVYSQWRSSQDRGRVDMPDLADLCMYPVYLSRLSELETDRLRIYDSSAPPFHTRSRSVIAFGNFGRIHSYSYIRDEIAYYTMNDDCQTRYFVVHDTQVPSLNLDVHGWEVEDL